MTCDQILPLLEPFLDRACNQIESRLITSHLDSCLNCAESLNRLVAENHFYLSVAERVDLQPSLWESILRSTESPSLRDPVPLAASVVAEFSRWIREWRLAPLPALAILLLAVGLTISFMKYASSNHSSAFPSSVQVAQSPVPAVSPASGGRRAQGEVASTERVAGTKRVAVTRPKRESASKLVREAEAKYLAAIAILERDAQRRHAQLDEGTRAQLEQTIADVDRAISSTRRAVQQAPDDAVAIKYMLAAYSRKVDLLRQMVGD